MATTTYSFFGWNANYTYTKWDVVYGDGDTLFYYSTKGDNLAAKPHALFTYSATQTARTDDVMRVSFTQTGTTYFQPGSIVEIYNVAPDASSNYSGVCLGAGAGYVDILNPGLSTTNAATAGTVRAPIHPYWTTGFYWVPAFSTSVDHNQAVINTQLGEGYSQRMNPCINSNSLNWNLMFENRTDKEARSLLTFVQNMGGVAAVQMPFPVGLLYNVPTLKYILGPAKHSLDSYGLNSVNLPARQVFDL